jgi:NodT family efflux transporter outer membrane factor (OMF) lipoprotein
MTARPIRLLAALAAASLLGACTVGPDYKRPPAPIPASYKEAEGWKVAEPKEAGLGGPWWAPYNDPVLDGLLQQIQVSNQTLKAQEAAYRQSIAVLRQARSGLFPVVTVNPSAQRSQTAGGTSREPVVQNRYDVSTLASWDLDLWGRVRRSIESNEASVQASAADLAAVRLSLQAALATDYYELRVADQLKRLLDATVADFTRSLQITRNQHNAGVAALSDVITAQTQLDTARAQAINVGVQRAQLEHAIAALIGKPPADFSIAPAPLTREVPVIPTGVPSTLLERRPDIAAAERQMAAANAQIGVAVAAYYPDITLSGSFGYAAAMGPLFAASNQLWSFGATIAETIFDGGLRDAQVEAARAVYDQTVANYRQTVLTAFQQVEDQLAALRILEQQAAVVDAAVRDAREAVRLTLNEYQAGTVAYTTVITAQTTALSNEQNALTVHQNRLVASIALTQALGGGWSAEQLSGGPQKAPKDKSS